jgi:hypothetical protein
VRTLVNYNNPRSIGSRLRRRRFAHIEDLVLKVLRDKSTCEIIDIGGAARYWHLMDQSLLESCRITLVNLDKPWDADPWENTPSAGTFEFAIGDGRCLEFGNQEFDIAHSNSVMEHVGSFADMRRFVRESARVARYFYIQTPYFWFPIEPHFGFPLIHWLPVPLRCKIITRLGIGFRRKFGSVREAMSYIEAINLIDIEQARALLEDGRIAYERVWGIPKSLMLIRDEAPSIPSSSRSAAPRLAWLQGWRSSAKSLAANGALVVASVVVGGLVLFGAGELYFRLKFWSLGLDQRRGEYFEFHEARGWQMEPGEYLEYEPRTNRAVRLSTNDAGLRGPSIKSRPQGDRERISIIGDSFVFSSALPEETLFTRLVQDRLGQPYEVLNVGVPGYGTGQQYLMVEELLSKGYELGKLVLVFFTNDLQDNSGLRYSSLERNRARPRFMVDSWRQLGWRRPERAPSAWAPRQLLQRSYFLSFMRATGEDLMLSHPILFRILDRLGLTPDLPRVPGIVAGWYTPGWEARWKVTRDVLDYVVRDLRDETLADELTIVFMPSPFQTEPVFRELIVSRAEQDERFASFIQDMNRPQRLLAEFCKEHDVPFVDLTPALSQIAGAYFPREGHLTELGSDVVARVLHAALAEEEDEMTRREFP